MPGATSKLVAGLGNTCEKIVDLHSVFEGRGDDFELEDILSVDFYHAAVVAAYPDQPIDPPPADHVGKRRSTMTASSASGMASASTSEVPVTYPRWETARRKFRERPGGSSPSAALFLGGEGVRTGYRR